MCINGYYKYKGMHMWICDQSQYFSPQTTELLLLQPDKLTKTCTALRNALMIYALLLLAWHLCPLCPTHTLERRQREPDLPALPPEKIFLAPAKPISLILWISVEPLKLSQACGKCFLSTCKTDPSTLQCPNTYLWKYWKQNACLLEKKKKKTSFPHFRT